MPATTYHIEVDRPHPQMPKKIMESLQSRQKTWLRTAYAAQVFESWSWLANGEVPETRWQRWQRWQRFWMGYRWLQMATVDVLKIWLWFLCGFQRSFSRCADLRSERPGGGLCFEGADATSAARLLSRPAGNQKVLTPESLGESLGDFLSLHNWPPKMRWMTESYWVILSPNFGNLFEAPQKPRLIEDCNLEPWTPQAGSTAKCGHWCWGHRRPYNPYNADVCFIAFHSSLALSTKMLFAWTGEIPWCSFSFVRLADWSI